MFIVGGAGMQQILQAVADGSALTPVDVSYSPAMIATAIELTTSRLVGGIRCWYTELEVALMARCAPFASLEPRGRAVI